MVNAAEADIICPAVAAEDPNGLLGKIFLACKDFLAGVAVNAFKSCNESLCSLCVCRAVVNGVKVSVSGCLNFVGSALCLCNRLDL